VTTHFRFPKDQGSFPRAVLRCVGVGECRKTTGSTMCPSYRATMEEKHSTRGRARLLWEMLQGKVIDEGWKSEAVKESLDLCLACKGCKGECPVSVDMATYKAEFLSHYYDGRLRPAHAYAFGYIDRLARLASIAPGIANFFSQTRAFSTIAKSIAGMPQQRQIPPFARQTFKRWFVRRKPKSTDNREVILWPDTFNNYFFPNTAKAAVEVLEAAGYRVNVPKQALCCGRPLYDFGMLGRAKRLLKRILSSLRDQIAAGIPVVVLEPSCLAVFRDEMLNLLPADEDAKRLSEQTFMLSEFLEKKIENYKPPTLARKAVVHGHCHQKALMGLDSDERVLSKLGLDFETLDCGCCGMAGSFGFEKDHYDISMQIGELVLLPAVRKATEDTLIIANGFSCREQIVQAAGRQPVHLAEVIQMAMHDSGR
jgi:Fe-S oxidoreductase